MEDAVVGDERNVEPQRGRSDPAIGLVHTLAQRMTFPGARDAEIDVDAGQIGPGQTTSACAMRASSRRRRPAPQPARRAP